jgi:hypothetical protein
VDVGSGMPDIGNAETIVFNNVTGINQSSTNNRSTWGSTKLLGRFHHTWFSLRTLLHELAHQWCAYVDYRDTASGTTQNLLHQDFPTLPGQSGFHWGRWVDNDNSCMDYDRADWINNGGITFNRTRHYEDLTSDEQWFAYWSLDQYLMDLIPASDVTNFMIVQNPSPAISDSTVGPYIPNPSAVNVRITNIQYEEGARNPSYLNSQHVFHQAIIVITKNTTIPTTFITNSQNWRTRHTANFRRASTGRAMVDTSLLYSNYSQIYIKDNNADTGIRNSSGVFWLSADLWVRNIDDNGPDNQTTIRGKSNWIYARIHNKSRQAYNNVTVNFYLANYSSLVSGTEFLYPVDWNPQGLLGSVAIPTVPAASAGIDGEYIAKLEWTADKIPPSLGWHPCLLCEIIPMEVDHLDCIMCTRIRSWLSAT